MKYCHRYVRVFLIFVIFEVKPYVHIYAELPRVSGSCGCFLVLPLQIFSSLVFVAFEFLLDVSPSFFHDHSFSGPYHKNENFRSATRNERRIAIETSKSRRKTGFRRRGGCIMHWRARRRNVTISHKRNVTGKRDKKKRCKNRNLWSHSAGFVSRAWSCFIPRIICIPSYLVTYLWPRRSMDAIKMYFSDERRVRQVKEIRLWIFVWLNVTIIARRRKFLICFLFQAYAK